MPTPHENLFELKKELRTAKDKRDFAELEFYGSTFGSQKQANKFFQLEDEYQKLRGEYLKSFYTVLEESHGVKKSDIIKKGSVTKKLHVFTVLLAGRLLNMHTISIDKKATFFLQGVALKENEKIELPAEGGRFPHVA